jgi:hypothetical protein
MTAEQREALIERAAIMEIDGGLSRRAATLAAFALRFPADYRAMMEVAGTEGETALYEYLDGLIARRETAIEGATMNRETKNDFTYGNATESPSMPRYEGIVALRYFTARGVPIKDFYAKSADSDKTTYSTQTPIEQNKRYKVCLLGRFLCLDIDRKLKDIESEGKRGDGLHNFYAWLEHIGKSRGLLPAYLRDIENYPCYTETPSNGLHLFFKYIGAPVHSALCPHVEIKTTQLSAGYKDDKPYVFNGDIANAPPLPPFIQTRLSQTPAETKTPKFKPLLLQQECKHYGKPTWDKIIEWTDTDGRGTAGRNEYAFSLALHAARHQWTKNETLDALRGEPGIIGLSEREIITAVESAYRRIS